MEVFKGFGFLGAILSAALLSACGDDDKKKEDPKPVPVPTSGTATAKSLPASFTSVCLPCHPGGENNEYIKEIKGMAESEFTSVVRNGKGGMRAITTTEVPDADMKQIYNYMNGK
jgi:hypothetical protein